MKPYYDEGGVTIFHADTRDVLPVVVLGAAPCRAVVLTDPPYGMFYRSNRLGAPSAVKSAGGAYGKDWGPVAGDTEPFDPAPILAMRVPTILWGANWYASRLPDSGGWLVWDKKRGGTISRAHKSSDAELAWTNVRRTVKTFSYLWDGFRREGEIHQHYHPTQKPVALMQWCLTFLEGDVVLDPYMGSGSVLLAAKVLGRRAIGIEIEERYCAIAAKRLSQQTLELPA